MDLLNSNPRSPIETLALLVHVPRMVDKARAYKKNCLGEYIYPCPLDKIILDFLAIDAEEFAQKAANLNNDYFERWILKIREPKSLEAIRSLNFEILDQSPKTQEQKEKFKQLRDKINEDRTDITTWVDLIDLEEGRK